jgi:hypothetical protein
VDFQKRHAYLVSGLISSDCIPRLRSDTVEEFQDAVECDFSVVALGCGTLRLGLR